MSQSKAPRRQQPGGPEHRDVALLMVDLVDSTSLVQALGDARAAVIMRRLAQTLRVLMQRCSGHEIDHTDGFLVLFDSMRQAMTMALELHSQIRQLGADNQVRLAARVGVHQGAIMLTPNSPEAIARGAKPLEVEGLAKPLCARICALAGAGQTLLSSAAFDMMQRAEPLPDAERLRWLGHGLYLLKGIDEPQSIYEVGYVDQAPLAAPANADKARLLKDDDLVTGWRAGASQEVPGRPGWVLVRKLGQGGYGESWLARESASGNQRAFKFCYMHSQVRSLQREVALFQLLQRALGQRDDIAGILQWQLDSVPFFIESNYCPLGDLAKWCASQGGAPKVPLGQRLELIAEVADALAAAHAVGVLHKDIKPGNVLMYQAHDGMVHARLTDFGIGAISAASRYQYGHGVIATGMTEILIEGSGSRSSGTRMYMAPEQVEGREATTHGDAYALGILLYQSVCGNFSQALAPGWEADIDDPLLRDDIAELIVRDPAQRIGNLQALAMRLRTLDERHVQRLHAQQQSARQAWRRRMRRLLVPVLAGLVALVLVLGLMIKRISDEAQRANLEAATATAVTDYLVGLFEQADPLHAQGKDLTVREVLDKGMASTQKQLVGQPDLQVRLLSAIGRVYQSLGLYGQAETILEQAWALTPGLDIGPDVRDQLRIAVVDARDAMGKGDAAEQLANEALADARRTHGPESVAAGRAASALGNVLNSKGEYKQAEIHIKAAIDIFEQHQPQQRSALVDALKMLAGNYIRQERRSESIPLLERALSLVDNDLDRTDTLETLGGALREEGRFAEALDRFKKSAKIYQAYNLTDHGQYAGVVFNIASIYSLLGDFEEARRYFAASLGVYRKIYIQTPHWTYALTLKALGGTLGNLGRYAEAEPLLRESMNQYQSMHGTDSVDVARMLSMIALVQVGQGKTTAGLRDSQLANAALKKLSQADIDNPGPLQSYAEAVLAGANALYLAGRNEQARQECAQMLAFAGRRIDYDTIYNNARRAKLLLCAGDRKGAQPLLERLDQVGYRDPWLDQLRKETTAS